jgi:hypothetical protein
MLVDVRGNGAGPLTVIGPPVTESRVVLKVNLPDTGKTVESLSINSDPGSNVYGMTASSGPDEEGQADHSETQADHCETEHTCARSRPYLGCHDFSFLGAVAVLGGWPSIMPQAGPFS